MAQRQTLRDLLGAVRPVSSPISVPLGGGAGQVDRSLEEAFRGLGQQLGPSMVRLAEKQVDQRLQRARAIAEQNPEIGEQLLSATSESQQRAVLRRATASGVLPRDLEPYAQVAFQEAEATRRVTQLQTALDAAITAERRTAWRRDDKGVAVPGEDFGAVFDELAAEIGSPPGEVAEAVWAAGLRQSRQQFALRSSQLSNQSHLALHTEDFRDRAESTLYSLAGSFDDPVAFAAQSTALLQHLDEQGRKGQIENFKGEFADVLRRFSRQFGKANPERARLALQVVSELEIDGRRLGDGAQEPTIAGALYEEIERLDQDSSALRKVEDRLRLASYSMSVAVADDASGFDAWFEAEGLPESYRARMLVNWDTMLADLQQRPSALQSENYNRAVSELASSGSVEDLQARFAELSRLDMHPTHLTSLFESYRSLSGALQSVQNNPLWNRYLSYEDTVHRDPDGRLARKLGPAQLASLSELPQHSASDFLREDGTVDVAAIEQARSQYAKALSDAELGYQAYAREAVPRLQSELGVADERQAREAAAAAGLSPDDTERLVSEHLRRGGGALIANNAASQTVPSIQAAFPSVAQSMRDYVLEVVERGQQMSLAGATDVEVVQMVTRDLWNEAIRLNEIDEAPTMLDSGLAKGLDTGSGERLAPPAYRGEFDERLYDVSRGLIQSVLGQAGPKNRLEVAKAIVVAGGVTGDGLAVPLSRIRRPRDPAKALAGTGLLTIKDLQAGEVSIKTKGGTVLIPGDQVEVGKVETTIKLRLADLPPSQTPLGFKNRNQLDEWLKKEENRQFLVDWATKAGELDPGADDAKQTEYARSWTDIQMNKNIRTYIERAHR